MIGKDERYDYAHFEFIMRGVQKARELLPASAAQISLSLHCETAEIMTAYTRRVEKDKSLSGLAAYSASRPQHSEGLAVFIASYLANETTLPNINLLHLSSKKAVQAALMMAETFPHIDFRREVTIGHLMLDIHSKAAELAKVNPPIRAREDVEYLWQALLGGELDWVCSDHACCRHETKIPKRYFGNIWMAKSGFGGTEYLLPALVSEGTKRGMSYNHMARDIALVDPARSWVIAAKDSPSTQGYTPFEGLEMSARVDATFLRGMRVYENGEVIGKPRGEYLHRPTA
jgi:allantoinase